MLIMFCLLVTRTKPIIHKKQKKKPHTETLQKWVSKIPSMEEEFNKNDKNGGGYIKRLKRSMILNGLESIQQAVSNLFISGQRLGKLKIINQMKKNYCLFKKKGRYKKKPRPITRRLSL